MKVLWFTNTPSLAAEYLNKKVIGGGWLNALEAEIKDKVELHVAFYFNDKISSFKFNDTTYHPIANHKSSNLKRIISSIFNSLEPLSDIEEYIKIIEKVNPDIIHIHGTENPFGYIINRINIPVIISIQGIATVYNYFYFRGISKSDASGIYSLKHQFTFRSFIQNFKKFNKKALREQNILASCKYIIGRTEWDRTVSSILATNRTYFHCEEILRESFYNNSWKNIKSEKINLITTTNPQIYKGIETIYQTANLLESLNIDFEWKIAGIDDSDQLIKLINKNHAIKDLSTKVKLLGRLEEKELINHLLSSNIYVMVSHIENSPNNLCEAMILGMPIIATFAGGTSSLMKNTKEGILIQDGDPWSLAGSILEISSNYEKYITMGANARKIALQRHNKNNITNNLLDIYNKIIG